MRIAHNLIIDYHRQNQTKTEISNDEVEIDLFNHASIAVDENREKEMIDQQVLADIKALIKLLPESQREVVLMRYYDELSFKEIAEKTGVSINTALGRMRYALINLRRLADKYDVSVAV
jgi:RNA polymerase sigma-70 factor (ECF subfamily)